MLPLMFNEPDRILKVFTCLQPGLSVAGDVIRIYHPLQE